ncbi:MAG TPA: hypothetical protein VIX84_17070 [Acidimicrobiales bacterium]
MASMQGHVPGPPQPHLPLGFAPYVGYLATREPRPFDDRPPAEPGTDEGGDHPPLDLFDDLGPWERTQRPLFKAMAVVLSLSLVLAGLGTVVELLFAAR